MHREDAKYLFSIIALVFVAILIFVISAATNIGIVDFMQKQGEGPGIYGMLILFLIYGILIVCIFYGAYRQRKLNNLPTKSLSRALFLNFIILSLWGIALFHIKITIGISGFFGFLALLSTVWMVSLCVDANLINLGLSVYPIFFIVWLSIYTYRITQYEFVENSDFPQT